MSKLDRRNQAKQKRITNHNAHLSATSVFSGRDGAPRIVAIVPLCENLSTAEAARSLNLGVDVDVEVPEEGWVRTNIERFKQKVAYIMVKRDLLTALEACRVADYVVFVLSAEEEVDGEGEHLLRAIESQGLSNCFTVVQGLDTIEPMKRRAQTATSLLSYINHFLPAIEKVYNLDSRQESANLVRSLCTTTPKGISWREQRSWMMVEEVQWPGGKSAMNDGATGEVILTGVVRGKGLNVDRLVTVGDWGDFQVEKITAAPLSTKKRNGEVEMEDAEPTLLQEPTADREGLEELAPEEAVMEDASNYPVSVAPSEKKGVLLDDHHYFSDEYEDIAYGQKPKRLPKGTSKYQSAWFLDDVSDSGSDMEDIEEDEDGDHIMEGPANPADGIEGMDPNGPEPTEGAPTTYAQSEMFLDPSPEDEADQLAEYRRTRKDEADDDLEFPDEIELPPNVLARERLARYRGLKSLRTSHWETDEDKPHEPSEWPRLLEVKDFKGAVKRVLRETLAGGVKPGTRVNVHLKNVPISLQNSYSSSRVLSLFSLLRHEHKRTVSRPHCSTPGGDTNVMAIGGELQHYPKLKLPDSRQVKNRISRPMRTPKNGHQPHILSIW
jgi:pre-rRNA-processing protein TSR1